MTTKTVQRERPSVAQHDTADLIPSPALCPQENNLPHFQDVHQQVYDSEHPVIVIWSLKSYPCTVITNTFLLGDKQGDSTNNYS